ncbi:MAG: hypothetical protein JKY71_10180 [Alphaproteobacteria bacterium]|nr:hypothetical protein [Alphaproteobacteria bacterium]
MNKTNSDKVEMYHRINRLRLKAGLPVHGPAGVIDPKTVKKAQAHIDDKEEEYTDEVRDVLEKLSESWKAFKKDGKQNAEQWIEKIYNYSNNVKDLTSMYDHDLMTHFGLSLREFCEDIDIEREEHHVIVQAHIDVMWVTYEQQLRSDSSEKAEELKKVVAIAIDKYS